MSIAAPTTNATANAAPSPRSRPLAEWLGLLAIAAVSVLRFVETGPGNIDDAFILLVYLKHLLAAGSFFYNKIDGQLDGFTSPLDLFLKAAIVRVLHGDPILIVWWVTLLLHVSVAIFGYWVAKWIAARVAPASPRLCILLGLVFAGSQALGDGSAFLLETPLFVLLALLATTLVVLRPPESPGERVLFGLLLISLPLARPEGLVLALLLLALTRGSARILPAVLFALGVGAYYLWRVRTFGYWAPNTYYAKTSSSRWNEIVDGFGYVARFGLSPGAPALLWLLASPLFLFCRFSDPFLRRAFALFTLVGWVVTGVVIYAGGDCYGGGRFLALSVALSTLALFTLAVGGQGRARRAAARILATLAIFQVVVLVAIPIYLFGFSKEPVDFEVPLQEKTFSCDRQASLRIEGMLAHRPGARAAQTDFQRLKYFADDLYVWDLTGLNDRQIAHREVAEPVQWGKLDLLEAVRQRPEVIVLGHRTKPHARAMARYALVDVVRTADLHDDFFGYGLAPHIADALSASYGTASVEVCGGYFNFLARRDLLAELRSFGALVEGAPNPPGSASP